MSGAQWDSEIEELCAKMHRSSTEICHFLDGLSPDQRQIELKEISAKLLSMLQGLKAMNAERGREAWALFPELRLFEDLSPDQLSRVLEIFAEEL